MAMGGAILKFYPALAGRMSLRFSKLWVAVIFLALMFRMVGVLICMLKTRLNMKERVFCMIAYLPKATVQAAIGSLPLAMGLPSGKITLTVAVLAILIAAPLGAFGIDMTYKRLLADNSAD